MTKRIIRKAKESYNPIILEYANRDCPACGKAIIKYGIDRNTRKGLYKCVGCTYMDRR